ncbi:MAG: hypothetical protein KatS3mg102_2163 [Planctomycetota bacterium]|nr:MAG: hypothetical protein KatS3mg102_2163 [Planctomycetota bacterium]
MASGSVWGIDIGKSSLKAVRMAAARDEMEIQALALEEYEIGDDGTIAPGEASRALEDLIARYPSIKKEPVYVSLPGHTAFARFIKLPPFDARKLAEMVRFEAQQQIPFPIEEVNWDHVLLERDYEPDEEREVGLFAIKKELVSNFLADLSLSGIEPEAVTIAPLATYNFVALEHEPEPDKLLLVLDIGWEHTDLLIVDGQRFWIRNLALNGHELTKAIATKLRLPFSAAEELKRNVASARSQSRQVFEATQLVLRDFVAEVQRSLGFYKSQNRGRRLELGEVLLLGRGARLPNIGPFFQKELGCPVSTLKRLRTLALDVEVETEEVELLKEELPSFGVAFGLAIQGCGQAVAAVNLLPHEVLQRKKLERKKPLVAVAVGVLFVAVLLAWVLHHGRLRRAQGVLEQANLNLGRLERLETELAELRQVEPLERELKALAGVIAGHTYPLELLNRLAEVLPRGNDAVVAPSEEQRKVLERQGRYLHQVEQVAKEIEQAQEALEERKTWVIEVQLEADRGGARAILTVARRKVYDPRSGKADDAATLSAIREGLLADIQRVLPGARFEGISWTIYDLLPGADKPPPTGFGQTPAFTEYLAQKIVAEYPAPHQAGAPGEPVR